jgi:molecular chaperone DnaK (HSP70)
MNEQLHKVIGIDLGTTFSAVAAYNKYNDQAEIIVNRAEGDLPTTPSVVSLEPLSRKAMVGIIAKQNLKNDPQNTIIEIKREMGEEFRPETLKKYNAQNFFNENEPVKAHFAGQWLLPQQISAFILMKMKEIAESEIGEEIRDAVVTVPAYFTEKQKKATREAALLAGLYPRQIIPEPTAAAICYGVDRMEEERKVYLVFDLGGGTFDVSIIEVEEENIKVTATSGDPRLGGADFDDAITNWAVKELKQKYDIDVSSDYSARTRIKLLAEQAKIILSTHMSTSLSLGEIDPQKAPTLTLTREEFEKMIEKILEKSLTYVDIAIKAAEEKQGISRDKIDAILLVGGSSKIPKIKNMLLDYFEKDESFIRAGLNPDEVVARGAAILANGFSPSPPPFDIRKKEDNTLINVEAMDQPKIHLITEHSLGVEIQDKLFSKIVDQGSSIPLEITKSDYTNAGPTTDVEVRVYQGEGVYVYENTLIGTLHLGPIKAEPAGFHKFEVTFKLDVNGLLSMVVYHINEDKRHEARFEHKTGIGGSEALASMRENLLRIYAKTPDYTSPPVPSTVPPPPPGKQQAPQPQVEPSPQMQPSATQPQAEVQSQGPPASDQVKEETKVSPSQQPSVEGIIEPVVEIPDQFKSIVRRTKKQLVKKPNVDLVEAFNVFINALNAGEPLGKLEELYDELADTYDEARR